MTPATAIVEVTHEADIAIARIEARAIARAAGLANADIEAFATALSEIVRNVVVHAAFGSVSLGILDGDKLGVFAVVSDRGPGIPDVSRAMQDGYSTTGSMGAGLGGAARLVDAFAIDSRSTGTVVRLEKWLRGL